MDELHTEHVLDVVAGQLDGHHHHNVHGFIGLWEQGAVTNLSTADGYSAEDGEEFILVAQLVIPR